MITGYLASIKIFSVAHICLSLLKEEKGAIYKLKSLESEASSRYNVNLK